MPGNVATPVEALCVTVPLSVPLPGFAPMATFTDAVLFVRFPNWSSIWTVTAGVIAKPAWVVVGCCAKASLFGDPALTVKLLLVAPVRPVLAAFSENDPACVGTRFENVATPLTAATDV